MNRLVALKVLLAIATLFHVLVGLAAIVVPPGEFGDAIISATYGASMDINSVTQHVIRILGAFMIFVGVMAGFAYLDPQRNRAVIYALIVLFSIRVLQRIVFADEISEYFNISAARLVSQSIFFAVLAVAYFFLLPKKEAEKEVG